MNEIQKEINTLSKYFGQQFLLEGEIWTIQDCKLSVISNMTVVASHFIAYGYRNGVRTYRFDFDTEIVMKCLIEVNKVF